MCNCISIHIFCNRNCFVFVIVFAFGFAFINTIVFVFVFGTSYHLGTASWRPNRVGVMVGSFPPSLNNPEKKHILQFFNFEWQLVDDHLPVMYFPGVGPPSWLTHYPSLKKKKDNPNISKLVHITRDKKVFLPPKNPRGTSILPIYSLQLPHNSLILSKGYSHCIVTDTLQLKFQNIKSIVRRLHLSWKLEMANPYQKSESNVVKMWS